MLLTVNSAVTWWKIAVPVVTIIALMLASSHWNVWAADPNSYHFSGISTARPAAGIVFSYLGFRTAIDLGGESANPGRDIPLAVIGSVLIAAVIYTLLQIAFLMALRPDDLTHGWAQLNFTGEAGPFAGLAATLGLGWLAALLYIDAYISPSGTALMYMTGGSRILFATGETAAGPRWLTALNAARAPWAGVLVMWIVGVLFLLPFPAWQLMVSYITSVTVITYGLGPIVLLVLCHNQPTLQRPFRLWGAEVLAPIAFVCSNWILYWTGFRTDSFLYIIMAIVFVLYALYYHLIARMPAAEFGWRYIAWLLPWFGGMWIISAIGDVDGGAGWLTLLARRDRCCGLEPHHHGARHPVGPACDRDSGDDDEDGVDDLRGRGQAGGRLRLPRRPPAARRAPRAARRAHPCWLRPRRTAPARRGRAPVRLRVRPAPRLGCRRSLARP